MRLFRPSFIAGWLYPDAIFRIKTKEKILFLTFDDGPDPESTPQLLEILSRYNILALFFCRGIAAEKHPELIEKIKSKGHSIGNHGYNHIKGWRTSMKRYVSDIERSEDFTSSELFRPPYGSLRLNQYRKLKEKYRIIFWDIMPYDFDMSFSPDDSYKVLIRKLRPGSIIALHDQPGSSVLSFLSKFIETTLGHNYSFALPVNIQ